MKLKDIIHVREYYSALKRNEMLPHATTQMNTVIFMLSEILRYKRPHILRNVLEMKYPEYIKPERREIHGSVDPQVSTEGRRNRAQLL